MNMPSHQTEIGDNQNTSFQRNMGIVLDYDIQFKALDLILLRTGTQLKKEFNLSSPMFQFIEEKSHVSSSLSRTKQLIQGKKSTTATVCLSTGSFEF